MIWNMWPKPELQGYAGAEVVELSAHLAAARFIKHGALTVSWLFHEKLMGCTTGSFAETYVQLEDA